MDGDPKPMRRLNVRILPVTVGLFALLYGLTGYRGWLVFLIGTAGVWLLATLWILSLERGLQIERKIHLAWAGVGDSVPEQLRLINHGRLPAIWVELSDSSNSLVKPLKMVSDVQGRYTRTRHITHLFNRRGLYTLGPTRLRTGDPFGIYTLTLYNQHADTILVTPPVVPLERLQFAPGGWSGDQNRRRSGLKREISDAGTRQYLPGDSLKRIHWTASAHQDALIVRQLDAASSQDYWIFVDLDQAVQYGEGRDSTLELAIVLAASVTMRGLKERRRVGLVLAGPKLICLAPRSDPAHRWQIFRALATAEAGSRPLADLLSIRHSSQTASLILITPAIDPAWVAVIGKGRTGKNVRVLLIDPAEFGGHALQDQAISSLTKHGIPHFRMPKTLLDQAYASSERVKPPWQAQVDRGIRFWQPGEATWQSMD
jgi:uncharacterized protein (DUF58 family)